LQSEIKNALCGFCIDLETQSFHRIDLGSRAQALRTETDSLDQKHHSSPDSKDEARVHTPAQNGTAENGVEGACTTRPRLFPLGLFKHACVREEQQ
jgi:hypothetical protein